MTRPQLHFAMPDPIALRRPAAPHVLAAPPDLTVPHGLAADRFPVAPGRSVDVFVLALNRVHLQWFAAEDEGRTEEPTEHKIQKAREEGKVAKSADLASSVVLLFTVISLAVIAKYLLTTMVNMVSYFLQSSTQIDVTVDFVLGQAFMSYFVRLALPIAAVAVVAAFLGNIIQFGFLFSTKPITPDLNRIAPRFGRYLQRTLFSTEAMYNLAKSVGKILIILAIAALNIVNQIRKIMNVLNVSFLQGLVLIAQVAFSILLETAIVLLVLAILDFLFQRRQHIESLKMTRQEVKEERRSYEGDPAVKNRLRRRMQELLQRNMVRRVPEADVVVTNPTHYAVALEYKRATMSAPTVTAKGQDNIALKIREVAEQYEVPIVENRPLARALYADVEIGDEIPEMYYEAVVAVLKQVYLMTGRRREEA